MEKKKIVKAERILPERKRGKRITPKKVFLQFLHQLFAASLVGKVEWWPEGRRGGRISFRATFGLVRVKIALWEGEYLVEVVFPTPSGDFSIDGSTSTARVGTFASVFWAAMKSFNVRKMMNRKALDQG